MSDWWSTLDSEQSESDMIQMDTTRSTCVATQPLYDNNTRYVTVCKGELCSHLWLYYCNYYSITLRDVNEAREEWGRGQMLWGQGRKFWPHGHIGLDDLTSLITVVVSDWHFRLTLVLFGLARCSALWQSSVVSVRRRWKDPLAWLTACERSVSLIYANNVCMCVLLLISQSFVIF